VVLKGPGSNLTHKTENELVKLNIRTSEDLEKAAVYVKDTAGADLEGFLLQPMLEGDVVSVWRLSMKEKPG